MPCPPSFGRAADRGEITMEWSMEPIAPPSVVQEILASLAVIGERRFSLGRYAVHFLETVMRCARYVLW